MKVSKTVTLPIELIQFLSEGGNISERLAEIVSQSRDFYSGISGENLARFKSIVERKKVPLPIAFNSLIANFIEASETNNV